MGTQSNQVVETASFRLLSNLQCPSCASNHLVENPHESSIDCNTCQQSYPLLSFGDIKIPFIFNDVNAAIQGWCARINGFNQKIEEDIELLMSQAIDKHSAKLTRKRLKSLLSAKKQYRDQVNEHLECFSKYSLEQYAYIKNTIAKNQGVDSYINNIFRDWSWDNGENEQQLSVVNEVISDDMYKAGVTLTLGAGASRLSYDFHQEYCSTHSVLLDINPMLLGAASKILNGEVVSLNEFPVAPLSIDYFAVSKQCQLSVKQPHVQEFSYILADVLNVPLAAKTFDTVLTPWVIDIIPMDLREFIPHINRLLKTGGVWVNTGSLAFFHNNQQWNYSEQEVIDLLKKFGFDEVIVNRTKIDYLNSPHSAHGRIENVFSFSAKKKFDSVVPEMFNYFPEWINNPDLKIPNQAEILASSSKHLLQAQVLSAINGERSIAEIGHLLAKQYEMSEENAFAAVRQILIDNL